MKTFTLALAAGMLAGSALTGCSGLPVDTTPPEDTHVICKADSLGWTIGKEADETLVKRAQLEATARIVRVLRPGQMVTMEYSDQRLNIHVDANNRVTSYSCS
jgi:hypothetical protein